MQYLSIWQKKNHIYLLVQKLLHGQTKISFVEMVLGVLFLILFHSFFQYNFVILSLN